VFVCERERELGSVCERESVCVCVCVCVRDREREKERAKKKGKKEIDKRKNMRGGNSDRKRWN
jgi:hypothetical protein